MEMFQEDSSPRFFIPKAQFVTVLSIDIVCQINILAGVQALAWICQAEVWFPFSESL